MSTLLIVDDSENNRRILVKRLEKRGYDILPAKSGRQAIETLRNARVDLILLDNMMPEMDGMETFEKMKEMMETPPPVFMRILPGGRSTSSWMTRISSGSSLKNPAASPTAWPERFM